MPTSKTGRHGSRVSQRKKKEMGRPSTKRALTVDDFDLNVHANGSKVDPVEGREARLPYVIRGMRENKSIRQIAFEINCAPATVAYDKKWVLEEAWELRQDLIGLWLEEQLQGYERLLTLLDKELMFKKEEGLPEKMNLAIVDKMLSVMDKVNELKGLKQPNVIIPISPGDNATFNFNADAAAAHELMDVLKPRKVGSSKKALVS